MHYLALIIGFAVAAGFLIWRIRNYLTMTRMAVDTVRDVKAGLRRSRWNGRSAERPLEDIDDPMLVAACILLIVIRCDRDVTVEDRERLAEQIQSTFRVDRADADDLLGEAEFLVRDVTDHQTWAARLGARLATKCSLAERAQVLEMAQATAPGDHASDRRTLVLERFVESAKINQR